MGNLNFYPRSPCGERRCIVLFLFALAHKFLSTLSLRRATARKTSIAGRITSFLSTLSLRRATKVTIREPAQQNNFYPRSPCGERHKFQQGRNGQNIISIHALLAESDFNPLETLVILSKFLSTLSLRRATESAPNRPEERKHFYPRSPCGERPHPVGILVAIIKFLSTLSLRRAT